MARVVRLSFLDAHAEFHILRTDVVLMALEFLRVPACSQGAVHRLYLEADLTMPSLPKNAFEMSEPYFDKKDQHDRLESALVPGETLWMTLDCKGGGTGFVGITDKRLIFQDQSWRKSKNVLVSVPLDRVHAVGISTNQPLIGRATGVISIQAGEDDWAFEFRNAEKTGIAYKLLMSFVLSRETNTPDTAVAGVG